jgi:hypothetical protein
MADIDDQLDRKAAYINEKFQRLDRAEDRKRTAELTAHYARNSIGALLVEARDILIRRGRPVTFEAWCEANIKGSIADVYPCMLVARADDPEAAMWKERAEVQPCLVCGVSFVPKRSDARYCSSHCRQKAYRGRGAASLAG